MVRSVQVKRLGGWTRLWVVASIIWIAGSALVTVLTWPNRENYMVAAADTSVADATASTGGRWQDGTVVGGTRSDIEAAIKNAEKAGDSADVAKLRAYLETLSADPPKTEGPWTRYAAAEEQAARKDRAAEGGGQSLSTYEVRAPNGRTYEVQGPKSATDEQIRNEVLRQHPDAAKAPGPQYDNVAFANKLSQQLWSFILAGFIPPALLAVAMFAFDWIRRGFAG